MRSEKLFLLCPVAEPKERMKGTAVHSNMASSRGHRVAPVPMETL